MRTTSRRLGAFAAPMLLALVATATAQDSNVRQPVEELERLLAAEPLAIVRAEISRPNAKGDITLKADVSFGGAEPLRVKLRKAEPGADSFNNVPRYDLAAYELQKLFLDPAEYVVPPTGVRMVALADFAIHPGGAYRTFPTADQVMAVVQYWLSDVKAVADVYDPGRFAADPVYARHIGQLNVFTHLIRHGDSNLGNFLIGNAERGARVFSIDHGVAFDSEESDRGDLWKDMRVNQLPADLVERLRKITPDQLTERLGVLAQWQLRDGNYVAVPKGVNLSEHRGVRRSGDDLQIGLNKTEIRAVNRRLDKLLELCDAGKIALMPAPGS